MVEILVGVHVWSDLAAFAATLAPGLTTFVAVMERLAEHARLLTCIATVIASLSILISEEHNRHLCSRSAHEKATDNIRHEMRSR